MFFQCFFFLFSLESWNSDAFKYLFFFNAISYKNEKHEQWRWNISKIFLHSSPNTKMTVTYKPKNIEPTIKTGNEISAIRVWRLSSKAHGTLQQWGAELCNLRCQGRWASPKPKSQDWLWALGHHCVYIVSGPHWSLNCIRAGEKQTALDWKMSLPLEPIGNSQSRSMVLTLGKNPEVVLDS